MIDGLWKVNVLAVVLVEQDYLEELVARAKLLRHNKVHQCHSGNTTASREQFRRLHQQQKMFLIQARRVDR